MAKKKPILEVSPIAKDLASFLEGKEMDVGEYEYDYGGCPECGQRDRYYNFYRPRLEQIIQEYLNKHPDTRL